MNSFTTNDKDLFQHTFLIRLRVKCVILNMNDLVTGWRHTMGRRVMPSWHIYKFWNFSTTQMLQKTKRALYIVLEFMSYNVKQSHEHKFAYDEYPFYLHTPIEYIMHRHRIAPENGFITINYVMRNASEPLAASRPILRNDVTWQVLCPKAGPRYSRPFLASSTTLPKGRCAVLSAIPGFQYH